MIIPTMQAFLHELNKYNLININVNNIQVNNVYITPKIQLIIGIVCLSCHPDYWILLHQLLDTPSSLPSTLTNPVSSTTSPSLPSTPVYPVPSTTASLPSTLTNPVSSTTSPG